MFTIYWVAYEKHGNLTHLEAGPFINWEDAENTRRELNSNEGLDRYTVVESDVEVRVP